ncbi:MAG: FAD-dependent oxidoreductase [Planctomycetota bacterium]
MQYDVAVVGGGTGGVPAALAAARSGATTILLERYGFLGGMATAGLINPFMGYRAGSKKIVAGVFAEILEGLAGKDALSSDGHIFDEEALKIVLDELIIEAGVKTLFHSTFVSCRTAGGRIESAAFATKGGPCEIEARVFVDATGDADLACEAGARVEVGRAEDGLCQPMTLCFRLGGIDRSRLPDDFAELRKILNRTYLDAKAEGRLTNPREDVLVFKTLRKDVLHFNTTRIVGLSTVSPEDLSAAEFEGRRQMTEMTSLFREKVPGFENSFVLKSALLTGVRESRRVIGPYVLTANDVLSARKFPDAVACSSYPIDIHNPAGAGTVIRGLEKGQWYEIPYRCLVPDGLDNLLIASRGVSATHEAHASLRIMPVVAAIGQAAGTAAAMACAADVKPSEIDHQNLRAALRKAGAFVGEGK